ncbi:GNAT family N-acetyltransferase [Photobacterium alginatilyticum]|uniref:GNAT family N-acetyltransferase n=1 Tax=Photobacterium alginatilyticum TaxID=1775171 RepID=A0ABW9YRI3_9GAMM|nr:GNAT family N-acetyltransferase [Photobacterium alginatilyticum]
MVQVREMDISDYQDVINLWTESEGMTLRDADSKENIEAYLKRNQGLSFVAVDNNQILGAVLVGTDGRRGYLQHLSVSSAHRSKGIGQQLVDNAISALGRIGISKTHLFVHNTNEKAQCFYQKMGWFPRDEVRMFSYNSSSNSDV